MTLQDFFQSTSHGAIAYSGGVDSSLLVWATAQYGRDWRAYYVRTVFQPEFELLDAKKIAAECGIPLTILEGDILQFPEIRTNPADRCYHCKHRLFSAIGQQAAVDGCSLLIDGTNASDDEGDRPGMRALRELRVRSPLRECGLTKGDVRQLCREVHLSVWNKPAYACLATRIPTGTPITREALWSIEQGENLLSSLGFQNFRIRLHGGAAVLQVQEDQFSYACENREAILARLSPVFSLVTLDLVPRRRGE